MARRHATNRHYTLGARSLRLASAWIDRLLQVAAQPMTRIANSCGETVYLLQLVGSEAVTLARLPGTRRTVIDVEVGPSYSLWATAAGRALLGTLPRAQALRGKSAALGHPLLRRRSEGIPRQSAGGPPG
jgi:IclR family transcriptional regulator, acetate operon repressor